MRRGPDAQRRRKNARFSVLPNNRSGPPDALFQGAPPTRLTGNRRRRGGGLRRLGLSV